MLSYFNGYFIALSSVTYNISMTSMLANFWRSFIHREKSPKISKQLLHVFVRVLDRYFLEDAALHMSGELVALLRTDNLFVNGEVLLVGDERAARVGSVGFNAHVIVGHVELESCELVEAVPVCYVVNEYERVSPLASFFNRHLVFCLRKRKLNLKIKDLTIIKFVLEKL